MRKLIVCLACACGGAVHVAPRDPVIPTETPLSIPAATSARLPEGVTPVEYDLTLDVDPRKGSFRGHTRIVIKADGARRVVLHAREMNVSVVTIDGSVARHGARAALGGKREPEELVIEVPERVVLGSDRAHTIDIDYEAPFNKQLKGLYKVEQDGKAWAFTQLEAIDARRMFPGFDEPRFKTPFTVHVRAPEGMTVVANEPLTEHKDGVWSFAKSLPLPTYLIALAVGDLEITEGPKKPVPIRLVSVPGKGKLGATSLEAAAQYLEILGRYFDRPYPYAKLDLVAVNDFGPGAMENPGLVTFREELLLLDPKRAPIWARRRMEGVVAHELAHQWFGDLVTMRWWDDVWLNEGFATWMAAKAVDERRPEMRARAEMVGQKLGVMSTDAMASARPVRVPVETSDAILESGGWTAYIKGQGVLAMLESYVGERAFQEGLRAYVKSHELGVVTSEDLIASLSKATGKDLGPIARSFLDQAGAPLVEVSLACEKGASVRLTQRPIRALGSKAQRTATWTIPVCLRAEGVREPVCTLLAGESAEVSLPRCPGWIEPNAGDRAYYRWSMPLAMTRALARSKSLDEPERAALVSNAWALVQAGSLEPNDALALIAEMDAGRDPSRVVLEQVIAVLGAARDTVISDASVPAFRALAQKMLKPALARLGEDPRASEPEDDRLARVAVTGALFDLADDADVKKTAEKRALRWLEDPSSVDPDLAALALRVSSRAKGAAKPSILRARLAGASPSDRVILTSALGSSPDPNILRDTLGDVLSGAIRAGDFRYLWVGASRQPDSRVVFTDYVMAHFDELGAKLGGAGGLASLVGWTCDWKRQTEVASFFEQRMPSLEGAQRSFEEGREASELCISLREHHAYTAR